MSILTILHGCRTIQLTRGFNALIDEEDGLIGEAFRWRTMQTKKSFYAVNTEVLGKGRNGGTRKRRCILLHRTLTDVSKGMLVDHHNGDGLDNRRNNLRVATHTQNLQNIRAFDGKCRFKGVTVSRSQKRFYAHIRAEGKRFFLGSFPTQEDAARAYDEAARQHFGEFACTNADIYGAY